MGASYVSHGIANGGRIAEGCLCVNAELSSDFWTLSIKDNQSKIHKLRCKTVINCAGLYGGGFTLQIEYLSY